MLLVIGMMAGLSTSSSTFLVNPSIMAGEIRGFVEGLRAGYPLVK
jgi:hypothetical protein